MQAFFANFANGVASKMYQKKLQGQRARPGYTPSVCSLRSHPPPSMREAYDASKHSIQKAPSLGEGGLTRSDKTEGVSLQQKSRRTKSAAALRGVTSQPALCDDPPHTGQIDPTQQMLQYDQHGILLSDRPFQPNSPFSKNRSSLVKLPPPKRPSSGPRP